MPSTRIGSVRAPHIPRYSTKSHAIRRLATSTAPRAALKGVKVGTKGKAAVTKAGSNTANIVFGVSKTGNSATTAGTTKRPSPTVIKKNGKAQLKFEVRILETNIDALSKAMQGAGDDVKNKEKVVESVKPKGDAVNKATTAPLPAAMTSAPKVTTSSSTFFTSNFEARPTVASASQSQATSTSTSTSTATSTPASTARFSQEKTYARGDYSRYYDQGPIFCPRTSSRTWIHREPLQLSGPAAEEYFRAKVANATGKFTFSFDPSSLPLKSVGSDGKRKVTVWLRQERYVNPNLYNNRPFRQYSEGHAWKVKDVMISGTAEKGHLHLGQHKFPFKVNRSDKKGSIAQEYRLTKWAWSSYYWYSEGRA